jgi:cytochrome bd-type quinol oxidase subunit 2
MIHPLFRLVADRPQMIADHVEAYCALAGDELSQAATSWQRRIALKLAALACMTATVMLGGVALLLWGSVGSAAIAEPLAMWIVPLVPAIAALLCVLAARNGPEHSGFSALRAQLAADAQMLRDAGAA